MTSPETAANLSDVDTHPRADFWFVFSATAPRRRVRPDYEGEGTLQDGSRLALSVPEGLARAIYYAFLVSETHPFDDGNGRLSRLIMNAELSRLGLGRIIIPTLFHPQYVDCQRALTRADEPEGFIKALAFAARWSTGFSYGNLPALIASLRATNAFEEPPNRYKLLNPPSTTEG